MAEQVTVEGIDELNLALGSLPGKLRERSLRRAARKGGNIIRDKAKAKVPKRTGRLKESITVTVRFPDFRNVDAEVGPKSAFKFIKVEGALGQFKQLAATGWYAHFVEFGHVLKARGKIIGSVPPRPFLRPAADESVGEVVRTALLELDKDIVRFNRKQL